MRGAALADLHLGFRAYQHTTGGRNTREVDVEAAWFEAVGQILKARPDIVTIAGDVFHHPRVSDYAKKSFLDGIRILLDDTTAHVIVLQGNHDAGRTQEVLTPIALASGLGQRLHIVTEPKRIQFRCMEPLSPESMRESATGQRVSVSCFPFVVRQEADTYELEPDPDADVNVLCMHAAARTSSDGVDQLPRFYAGPEALDIGYEADRWDATCVGDYHEFTRLHPDRIAFYSGAIERTSNNIWQETAPKGWVEYDTSAQTLEFHEIPTRPMFDYDLSCVGQESFDPTQWHTNNIRPSAEAVNDAVKWLLDKPEHADSMLRLKVDEFPREERQAIDWSLVRDLKSLALHFELSLRFAAGELADLGDRRDHRARSLGAEVLEFFKDDDEDVRDLAVRYLDVAAGVEDAAEGATCAS